MGYLTGGKLPWIVRPVLCQRKCRNGTPRFELLPARRCPVGQATEPSDSVSRLARQYLSVGWCLVRGSLGLRNGGIDEQVRPGGYYVFGGE